ncbi:MAG: Ig-like domain repeat protein [Terracidiphilus sp.]
MAIVSAAFLRRFARIETLVLIATFLGCVSGAARAQVPVSAGTVLNMPQISLSNNAQVYKILVAKNGNVLFLDTYGGGLYQLAPGATSITTISASGAILAGGGKTWNAGMALDSNDTLYIGTEWVTPYFYRVPYDAATGTWPLTGSSDWPAGDAAVNSNGARDIAFADNGDMVFSTESDGEIIEMSISADGSTVGAPGMHGASGSPVVIVKDLTAEADKIAVDHAGNIYFIEGCWSSRSSVAEGVWMIPASAVTSAGVSGTPIAGEASPIVRIDPTGPNYAFKGITVDAAGNLYLSSATDGYGGNESGVLMVPNESGNPKAPSFSPTWADASMVVPFSTSAAVAIDPRGFLWVSTFTNTGVTSLGSTELAAPAIPYTKNWTAYAVGSANLGSSLIGTAGNAGTIYYNFSASTTPGSFVLSQPGNGSDFAITNTNPLMNPATKTTPASVDTTVVPCTAGTTYKLWQACPLWVVANPRVAGAVSGQLQMLDASNKIIGNSAVSVFGVGEGPEISFLGSNVATTIVSNGTDNPGDGQVAVDSSGNLFSLGNLNVKEFPAGSTPATAGTVVYQSSTQPTGVAVDGFGNLYVGDHAKVYEVPNVSGALDMAAQTALLTGLGNHLNLVADGAGEVYVADQDNAQVVKISNAAERGLFFADTVLTVGSGFTAPSALAVDDNNDLYIADGEQLYEITPEGFQASLPVKLAGSVTGLAVDASGSVYVAQTGGLTWIPSEATASSNVGTLTSNGAIPIAFPAGSTPVGVALDRVGNLFVSASGTQQSVVELSVNGSYDFGQVIPKVETDEEIQAYNIGNLPLMLSAPAGDASTLSDFYAETAGDTPACGTTTSVPGGTACYLGLGVTPLGVPPVVESATLTIGSNASNEPSSTLVVSADAVNDTRNATTTVITPITGLVYPGNPTITVTVTSPAGTPTGNVDLSLTGHGTISLTLKNGIATYSPAALFGGNYTVKAVYQGTGVAGTAPDYGVSVGSITFSVALATPVLSVPAPVKYIVYQGTTTITANVNSVVGTPTGTVTFNNGASLADPNQGPITLDGQGNATFDTSGLACAANSSAPNFGVRDCTYTLTAVYSGDQNFAAATFTVATFQIVDPSMLVTASPATLTLTPGTPGTVALNLQALVGYGGLRVSLTPTCISGVPEYAECTFDNTAIPIVANQTATVNMTISTNVPVNGGVYAYVQPRPASWTLAGLFGFGLIGLVIGRKSRFNGRVLTAFCLILLLAGVSGGVTACTNNGYTHTPPAPVVTTPAGTYPVVVTFSQYGTVHSLPFTLNVTVN